MKNGMDVLDQMVVIYKLLVEQGVVSENIYIKSISHDIFVHKIIILPPFLFSSHISFGQS